MSSFEMTGSFLYRLELTDDGVKAGFHGSVHQGLVFSNKTAAQLVWDSIEKSLGVHTFPTEADGTGSRASFWLISIAK
ncbi:hypothetical protein GCM10007874_58650 [Labrys miyagiensis]|uniref:Uncharacterized protein n=1 Tax=Labrys miyagiensis TaxID=346912 RepID=A0ABQ6CSV2_9HYPH|nr:hypothetical protein GCM10007874_58650 [Labrys miyagiensis]